jgi:peptide/nickel transport system permease protein
VLFAFPGLLLALLFVAVSGTGAATEIVAVALASAPGYARMIRGQVLAVRSAPYVEASRALGHAPARVIARTILPNAMRPLVVLGTLGVGQSIVWASSLSFLGLGVAPPAPEWGAMLNAGRDYIQHAWWLDFFPGAVIVAFTLAATAMGRYLQQLLEGRLTR